MKWNKSKGTVKIGSEEEGKKKRIESLLFSSLHTIAKFDRSIKEIKNLVSDHTADKG